MSANVKVKADVWMPLYVGDYLADTQHLTCEQHGAYFLLMMFYWRHGELPNDDAQLASIAKISAHKWKKIAQIIRKFFCEKNEKLSHKRIDEELSKAAENRGKRSDRAKKAATARWQNSNAPRMPQECPSPSPSPSVERRDTKVSLRKIDDCIFETHESFDLRPEAVAVGYWNETAAKHNLPKVQKLTQSRLKKLKARLSDCGGVDGWATAMEKITVSPFLLGQTADWNVTFDWLCKPSNFTKVMEGNYDGSGGIVKQHNGFADQLSESIGGSK